MSTLAVLRMYFKLQSMPRLPIPTLGNAGILYTRSLIDRNRDAVKEDIIDTDGRPEVGSATKRIPCKYQFGNGSYWFRRYSTSTQDIKKAEKEREQKKKFKVRTAETVKVLLQHETGSLEAVTVDEANKIARKKGLQLVLIENEREKPVQTEKMVYKLVNKMDLIEEEADEDPDPDQSQSLKGPGQGQGPRGKAKELKSVLLKSNIDEHDLNSKLNSIEKWGAKGHRVRVLISGDKVDPESVFDKITQRVKEAEGEIQQKVKKGHEIRFYIGPPKKKAKAEEENENKSKSINNLNNKKSAKASGKNENSQKDKKAKSDQQSDSDSDSKSDDDAKSQSRRR